MRQVPVLSLRSSQCTSWYIASTCPKPPSINPYSLQKHRWIGDSELQYIEANVTTSVAFGSKPPMPPIRSILRSVPFWALVVVHFGNAYGYYALMAGTPMYLSEIMGFAIEEVRGDFFELQIVIGYTEGSVENSFEKEITLY